MAIELIIPVLLVLALLCQWVAWRVKLPAILFLLLMGLTLGPGVGWIRPDELFGDLLMPMVSLSVAIILFEGSLTLNIHEIKDVSKVVQRMISVGALVTWLIVAVATHLIFDFSWEISALFGAVVIVTGPTVIVPMLRSVRPTRKLANILRWEGIAIDPVGALMAVLTYEFILASIDQPALGHVIWLFLQTVFVGVITGIVFGWSLGRLLSTNIIPEYLHNFATLSFVLLSFGGSNAFAHESGLIAVTVMGMWLANKARIDIHPILNFKEHLSILLISMLFIVLAARLDLMELMNYFWRCVALLLVLQFIARPVKILVSTIGLNITWRERGLLAWIAPRGIVAAAISAIFADRLVSAGYPEAGMLVPLTFAMIIGAVVLQSCTASSVAKLLGVAEPEPNGFLFVGANAFARLLAKELVEQGYRCVLADTSTDNLRKARMDGLEVFYGNPASEHADLHLDLSGIGHLLAMSNQRHINTVSAIHFRSDFGAENIFRLTSNREERENDKHKLGLSYQSTPVFGENSNYAYLMKLATQGCKITRTKLTDAFTWQSFKEKYQDTRLPLFKIDEKKRIKPFIENVTREPEVGCTILAIEVGEASVIEDVDDSELILP